MKIKTTNKQIKNYYELNNILKIGYCDLQNLLRFKKPFAYSAGVYGWNCDFYDVNGVCICTGYRPINGKKINYDLVREYEQKAQAIKCEYDPIRYEQNRAKTEQKIDALLNEFIQKAMQ